MSTTTKSPKAVLKAAYEVGKEHFPSYSHRMSRKTFTQPQLFACLVLKAFLNMDYRGTVAFLNDFREVRDEIELREAPHFTTLQKACRRLLEKRDITGLLEKTLAQYQFKKTRSGSKSRPVQLTALVLRAGM